MILYFQGDVCIEWVDDMAVSGVPITRAADGAVVLAEGEATGHRHAFYGSGVTLFRDDALAQDMPAELYIGHVRIEADSADLQHEEHDTISLGRGVWRIRRQREFEDSETAARNAERIAAFYRIVED